jgi:hypothetical protein
VTVDALPGDAEEHRAARDRARVVREVGDVEGPLAGDLGRGERPDQGVEFHRATG